MGSLDLLLYSFTISLIHCAELTCHPPSFICPQTPVRCDCQGEFSTIWTATTADDPLVLDPPIDFFTDGMAIGSTKTRNGFTGVLINNTGSGVMSVLNFTFSESVNISCEESIGTMETNLQRASYMHCPEVSTIMTHQHSGLHAGTPSPPRNLRPTIDIVDTSTATVRLDWNPPLNDGGVAITNYLIFGNTSQQVNSTNTTITLTLNSTGQHFIEVLAMNDCEFLGNASSVIVDFDLLPTTVTTEKDTGTDNKTDAVTTFSTTTTTATATDGDPASNSLQAIGIGAGVGGVAILLLIIAILVIVCALGRRAGKSTVTKVNGNNEMMDGGYAHFDFHMTPNNGKSGEDPRIIEDEYSVLARQSGPQQARGGAHLKSPVQSEYSVLEQRNGAEPEMIQDYAYCRIGAEPKQPKKTVQYIEVETSTERVNRQKAPACNDVQYSAVKVKTHPEDDLLNLNNLLLQLRPVQSKWAQIAKALNITEDWIQHIRGTTSGEDYDCLVEVCDEWLESHRKQDMNPTWRAVSNALNRAGCKDLAKEIKDIYKTGKLPRSPSDDEVTAASASGDAPNSSYDDVIVTSPQKKPAMKPPAELPQYDDVIVTSPQKKPAMKPPAELPQYDDVITSSDAPPPIPPQRFEVQ